MNRYPLWKNLVIVIALVLGFVYTLPNFYGEAPAVQVSPLKAGLKADANLMNRVEEALKEAKLPANGIFLDQTSVKARFTDPDTQLKAKELLQSRLGEDYVVALNLLLLHSFGRGGAVVALLVTEAFMAAGCWIVLSRLKR